MGFSVILPTLNENGHIKDLINNISNIFENKQIDYEIIVVDDNSLDGTIETIKNMLKKKLNLKLIVRENKNKNLADSLNDGIKKSLFDNLIWMDADFQHPPKYIIKFIEGADINDAIICSRFLNNSERYFDNPELNKDINENQSYFYNKLCKLLLYKDITDYTSGFVSIKKKVFENYKLKGFYGNYFVDLIIYLKKNNYKVIEIPFKDETRASGYSKTVVNFNLKYIYTCIRYSLTLLISFFKKF